MQNRKGWRSPDADTVLNLDRLVSAFPHGTGNSWNKRFAIGDGVHYHDQGPAVESAAAALLWIDGFINAQAGISSVGWWKGTTDFYRNWVNFDTINTIHFMEEDGKWIVKVTIDSSGWPIASFDDQTSGRNWFNAFVYSVFMIPPMIPPSPPPPPVMP